MDGRKVLLPTLFGASHKISRSFFNNAPLRFCPEVHLTLCPTDVSHGEIALAGFYELALTKHLASVARQGGILVDVGANYGYYSCLWCGLNPANRAVAIEASPLNIEPLNANIRSNQFDTKIMLMPIACGERSGIQKFRLGHKDQTGWGGFTTGQEEDKTEVEVVRLDELMQKIGIGKIDVLKIDVEGADGLVLRGAQKILSERSVRHIFYEENHDRMRELGLTPGYAVKILSDYGYRSQILSGRGSRLINYHALPM